MENLITISEFPVWKRSQTNELFCTQLKEAFDTRNFQLSLRKLPQAFTTCWPCWGLHLCGASSGQAVKIVRISVSSWNGFDFKIQERNSGNKARSISVKKLQPNFKGWGFAEAFSKFALKDNLFVYWCLRAAAKNWSWSKYCRHMEHSLIFWLLF